MEVVARLEGHAAAPATSTASWAVAFSHGRWSLTDGTTAIDLPDPPSAYPGLSGMWVLGDGIVQPAGMNAPVYSITDLVQSQTLDSNVPGAPLPPGMSAASNASAAAGAGAGPVL